MMGTRCIPEAGLANTWKNTVAEAAAVTSAVEGRPDAGRRLPQPRRLTPSGHLARTRGTNGIHSSPPLLKQ